MLTKQTFSKTMLACIMLAALASCNNNPGTETADKMANDSAKMADSMKMAESSKMADTSKMAATPSMKMDVPFDASEALVAVKDVKTWYDQFMADSANRLASGIHMIAVGKEIGAAGHVMTAARIDDVAKAKAFMASPGLKERMAKRGVIGMPEMRYIKISRFNPDTHEKQWVEIWHQVKDYDAWLKVYDAEGTAAREAQGMIDVAMGRGIDDPSWVFLVFDIKDMVKAKAAMMSDDKKKLMMSAGVMGKPVIKYYEFVE